MYRLGLAGRTQGHHRSHGATRCVLRLTSPWHRQEDTGISPSIASSLPCYTHTPYARSVCSPCLLTLSALSVCSLRLLAPYAHSVCLLHLLALSARSVYLLCILSRTSCCWRRSRQTFTLLGATNFLKTQSCSLRISPPFQPPHPGIKSATQRHYKL